MSRRIVSTQLEAAGGESIDNYFDRVVKFIPSDVVAAYVFAAGAVAGSDVSNPDVVLWVVFVVLGILTPLWTIRMASGPGQSTAKTQAIVSTGAFCVWVFALGGPFTGLGWYEPLYGSLLLVLYTLISGLVTPREA